MWLQEGEFHVRLGGNTYINCPTLIAFNGESLFTLSQQEDGTLGIDFQVFDSSGNKVASIKKNNVYFGDKEAYETGGGPDDTYLRVKSTGKILAHIMKRRESAPAELDVSLSTYLPDGRPLELDQHGTNLGGLHMTDNTISNCSIGIAIGGAPETSVKESKRSKRGFGRIVRR
jgi:hypothetical protein